MIAIFKPTRKINTTYAIQPQDLLALGYKGVIVDIDNTLLAWDEDMPSQIMRNWIAAMHEAGIRVFLLSNNRQQRVAQIAGVLGLPYSASSLKPSRRGFQRGLQALRLAPEQVVVVGDQILTDILGANLMGLDSILVKPLSRHDIIYTWPNRLIEQLIYHLLQIEKSGDWGNRLD